MFVSKNFESDKCWELFSATNERTLGVCLRAVVEMVPHTQRGARFHDNEGKCHPRLQHCF